MPATRGELFAGVTVAIVTPFHGGEVDWDELGKLVDWHCEQGTDSPVVPHGASASVPCSQCQSTSLPSSSQSTSPPWNGVTMATVTPANSSPRVAGMTQTSAQKRRRNR